MKVIVSNTAIPAVTDSLHSARAELRSWLESAGSPHDGADDMVLAVNVNEAVANVVDHAYPTTRPGQVHLHAWVSTNAATRTRRVTVAVTDRGNWAHEHRSTAPAGYRGHGIAVMSGCTAEVHIQRSAGGTTVVLVGHDLATYSEAANTPDCRSSTAAGD